MIPLHFFAHKGGFMLPWHHLFLETVLCYHGTICFQWQFHDTMAPFVSRASFMNLWHHLFHEAVSCNYVPRGCLFPEDVLGNHLFLKRQFHDTMISFVRKSDLYETMVPFVHKRGP